jgi:hypothetical protein
MEEEELGHGRIVRVAQNGIQAAQLPVADLPAGKVERHLGLQVAVQSDEHDRVVARLDNMNHRRVAARKGPALLQGFSDENPLKPSDVVLRYCHVFKCFTKPKSDNSASYVKTKSDASHCVIWFGYYRICMSCREMEMLSVSPVFRVTVFL